MGDLVELGLESAGEAAGTVRRRTSLSGVAMIACLCKVVMAVGREQEES